MVGVPPGPNLLSMAQCEDDICVQFHVNLFFLGTLQWKEMKFQAILNHVYFILLGGGVHQSKTVT